MCRIKSVLVSVVLLSCVIDLSSAIKCYDCKSETNPDCADPFNITAEGDGKSSITCIKADDKDDPWSDLMLHDARVCYKFIFGDGRGIYESHLLYIIYFLLILLLMLIYDGILAFWY